MGKLCSLLINQFFHLIKRGNEVKVVDKNLVQHSGDNISLVIIYIKANKIVFLL